MRLRVLFRRHGTGEFHLRVRDAAARGPGRGRAVVLGGRLVLRRHHGVTANQFILLEAAERLEQALRTYAEDQKSGLDLYFPEQAARFEDPIPVREGKNPLTELCQRLMGGER